MARKVNNKKKHTKRNNRHKQILPQMYGYYHDTGRGFGFVTPLPDSRYSEDIFVPSEDALGAMDGDQVCLRISPAGRRGKAQGEITRVVERSVSSLVGTCMNSDRGYIFIPDNPKYRFYNFVLEHKSELAIAGRDPENKGLKVSAVIARYPKNSTVRVVVALTEVLGSVGDRGVDVLSIIKSYGFHNVFSRQVMNECNSHPDTILASEYYGREDFREYQIVTIDGDDSKDFDDAVFAYKMPNGNYTLQVHIADVSHYVEPMSFTDKEAYFRGTSVYFLDRILPMLPERLSNDLCSLNPGVDRLTMSVVMEISPNGYVENYRIVPGVIRSQGRLTYTKVHQFLQGESQEYVQYGQLLNTMAELAQILRSKRVERGSLEFAFPEYKVVLDANDCPISVDKVEITEANGLIEEFMILCNETVAEHITMNKYPMVYRVHDTPDTEKMSKFAHFVGGLGYPLRLSNSDLQHELARLIMETEDDPRQRMIHSAMLRSLKKAQYASDNRGHFGLASHCYCHFTSPIRRYPDLIVHRILKNMMDLPMSPLHPDDDLDKAALHLSEKERDAQDATREAEEIKKIEYMQGFIGQWMEGVICGVTPSGLFVELPNGIEGFVELSSMSRFYNVDVDNYRIVSRGSNIMLSVGDSVRVKVISASIGRRRVYFELDRKCEDR